MICNRVAITLLMVYLIITICQISEARPRIRHHRGDTRCTRCAPGWGVSSSCTPNKDTECSKCLHGSYSPHHSLQPCWICSRCGPGLYEAHPCTSKTDTVCDSCHRPALDNSDYHKKCRGRGNVFLAPEDAKNTGEETSLINQDNDELEEKEREIILAQDIEADILEAQKHSMQRF